MVGWTMDWRERPAVSPSGGFLIQSRVGRTGNFEVVVPWPDGGLAHYWRDNENAALPWHGPTVFGNEKYIGASVTESDFKAFTDSPSRNLEVYATREDGKLDRWWRENGGAYLWRLGSSGGDVQGAPSYTYTGAKFKQGLLDQDLESHHPGGYYRAVAKKGGGFSVYYQYLGDYSPDFRPHVPDDLDSNASFGGGILPDVNFVGVAIALTTLYNPTSQVYWKDMFEDVDFFQIRGDIIVAGVTDLGSLHVYMYGASGSLGGAREKWREGVTITVPTEHQSHELRPFRGRPCIFQGDYDSSEGLFTWHYGNLELVAPAKVGGIHHLYRDNGGNGDSMEIGKGWGYATRIGSAMYDEVSMIESNFGNSNRGNLELIARRLDQRGFDFFWRNEDLVWQGPIVIETPDPLIHQVSEPLTVATTLSSLLAANIDFSVSEGDLKDWLNDAENTPYPAISQALFILLQGRALKSPVFIDVISYNYENAPGISSPRSSFEVDLSILKAAIIEGFNNRHGTAHTAFGELLR